MAKPAKKAPVEKVEAGISKYRVIRPLSYKGERVEVGTVLEISPADLKNLNRSYLEELNPAREEAKKEDAKSEESSKQEGSEIDI